MIDSLFSYIISEVNSILANKRFFKKFHIKRLLSNTKKQLKKYITEDVYSSFDIYKFILFIDTAKILNLLSPIDNFSYTCYKATDVLSVSSGTINMVIPYGTNQTLEIQFKPVISIKEHNRIDMNWLITDYTPHISKQKEVKSTSTSYSSTVEYLTSEKKKITRYTDILEQSSYDILYNIFIICIENIFNNFEMRYLHEKEWKHE